MADILKISTPLVDRNNALPQNRQAIESAIPFEMSELSKVVKTNPQSELLQQNNGMPPKEEAPELLLNLLRDPAVTMNFLKNIYMLQEIINLIPVNNSTLSGEIQQLFDALLMKPGDIPAELVMQEGGATSFKGDLFDMLRELSARGDRPDVRYGVANLLKAISATLNKRDVLHSVANSLGFLANSLSASKNIFAKLSDLAHRFEADDAVEKFGTLKDETLALLREVEGSILFTPRLQKLLPMVIYNLSRFSDNPDHLQGAVNSLLGMLNGSEPKAALLEKLKSFLEGVSENRSTDKQSEQESRVLDALSKLIGKQAAMENMSLTSSEKLEKIIHSLLSSPCNFTPLLHFIVPVQDGDLRAFAEMWIDPNEQNESWEKGGDPTESMHLLIVFDVEGVGQFEAELLVTGKKIAFNLFCPPAYVDSFAQIGSSAAKLSANTGYSFSEVYVGKLERTRSLMDVFKTLPHRRTGIDVTV